MTARISIYQDLPIPVYAHYLFISLHDEQVLFFAAQLCICVQSWSIISIKFPGNTLNSTISMSANQLCPCQVLFSLLLITSMLTADILLVGVVFSFLVDFNSSMQIRCVNLMSVMYALFFFCLWITFWQGTVDFIYARVCVDSVK